MHELTEKKVPNSAVLFLLCLSCFIAYSSCLNNPFIWDDEVLVQKNPLIRGFGGFLEILKSDLYHGSAAGSNFYRPIQTISYLLDYSLWQDNPFGYHLTNIILHILVSFLSYLFVLRLTKDAFYSFLCALLFSLSPIHTEAVTYISGRAEMLMGIFLFSSFLCYLKDTRPGYLLSLFLFTFGLLSKELSLVFPFAIAGYDYYFRKIRLKRALPFFIIAFFYLALRLSLLKFATIRAPALAKYPLWVRLEVLPVALLSYLKILFLPLGLHMSRQVARPMSLFGVCLAWFALVLIGYFIFYLLFNRRISPIVKFLFFWFFLFLLPQSGLLPINAFVAEHFLYLSSISFFCLIAYILRRYLNKTLFVILGLATCLIYAFLTYAQNSLWANPVTFYQHIIRYSPYSFQAHNNLGLQYEYSHRYGLAIAEYERAIELEPSLLEAHSNLANIYFKMGRLDEAKNEYAAVERMAPKGKLGEIQNNIGCVLEAEGRLDEAQERYRRAAKIDPSLKFSHFNIARICFAKKDLDQAAEEIIISLGLGPQDAKSAEPTVNLFLGSAKDLKCAATFYNDLGVMFGEGRLWQAAISSFRMCLELEPHYADAHYNLGLALWNKGDRKEAVREIEQALKYKPNHQAAKYLLKDIIYK